MGLFNDKDGSNGETPFDHVIPQQDVESDASYDSPVSMPGLR